MSPGQPRGLGTLRLPRRVPPDDRRSLLKRWAKRFGGALAWTLVVLVALIASLAYHLQLRLAGVVAIETLTGVLNREIRGELTVGALHNVSFEKIVAENVVVRDAEGREIIEVARLAAWPDWEALWGGVIRVDRVRVRGGVVRLHVSGPDEDTVSIAEAFQPAQPRTGPPGDPPRVVVDDIVLDEILVYGDVPGLEGLRVEDVRLRGRVDAERDVRFSIWEGRGVLTGPYPGRTQIDNIVGFFDSDLENEGMEFYARAHRGDDRVRARIRLTRPDLEAPPVLDLRVVAEPLSTDTLREMEIVPDLGGLRATVRGHARLFGPADDLALRGELHSGAGTVQLRGQLPAEGTLVLEARTDRLRVDRLIEEGPATIVSGRARIALEPDPSGGEAPARRLHVVLDPLTIDGVAIPSFTMDGVLEEDALRVTALDAEHAGGETHASGRVGFDGSLDVHVSARLPDVGADPNVRRAAPGARGSLVADLDVRADEGAQNLRLDGRVTMRNLRYGSVRAARLSVRGSGGGALPTPRLDLSGDAEGLVLGDLSLGQAEVTIRGGPGGYDLEARSVDPRAGTRVAISGRATVRGPTWRLSAPDVLVDLGDGPWRGSADVRFTPGRSVELSPVVLARDGERIVAEGTYRFRGDDEIDVQLMNLDLAHLRPLAPDQLEGIGGTVDGQLALRGDLERRPQGRLSARIRDGQYAGRTGITGEVDLQLEGDTLTTDVRLDLGGAGELVAEGPIRVPPSALRDPARLIDEARFEGLRISAADLDVAPLLALAGVDDVRVSGRITTEGELTGSLRQPGVRDAVLVLDRVLLEGWDPLRAKLHLGFGEARLTIHDLWLADSVGELLTAQGDVPLPLEDLPSDLASAWRLARTAAWSLSVRLPHRRLDTWPEPLVERMPPGLAASASLTASNRDGEMRADLDGVARWVDAAVSARCAQDLRPLMTIRGRLEHDVATASISGFFGGERASVFAEAAAGLPLDDWVRRGGVDEFPSTEIVARVRGADMGDVPWLCTYGRGPINASLTAKDLLTGRSVVGAVLDLPRLQIWETVGERGEAQLSTEYRVHVRAGSTPERDALTACTILGISGDPGTEGAQCRDVEAPATGELLSRLRVPVRWNAGELLPEYVADGVITSTTAFEEVHVEPVLTLMPGIVSGDAIMDGEVNVRGTWEDLRLSGGLDLSQGHVQIEGLGQHLFDIEGRVELRGDEAVFPADRPLSARDGGGLATAYGRVGFEGVVPRRVNLELRADDFPVRREGMVLAWLTGRATIEGDIADEGTESRVRTRDFVVRLPDQSAGDLQSLETHSEILVVGEERPPEPGEHQAAYPVVVHVNATDPFWVRRSDFAALVTAQIDARYLEPNLYVGGWARIRRGTFEIFGKRFELQDSTMSFNASSPEIDPRVNITAIYEVPGRRGVTVTVSVTGTLTDPEISFSSTETNDRAEIIALLISGGRRDAGAAEREASEQAASFLAGLTAGILTLGLRQELGDVIPMLAIESEGAGGTRVRVGFNANELIPDFMRGFVTGAYIEGFVTAAADGGGSGAAGAIGGGVTVEFTLPEGFLLRGTYVPIDNGSLDVLFEP